MIHIYIYIYIYTWYIYIYIYICMHIAVGRRLALQVNSASASPTLCQHFISCLSAVHSSDDDQAALVRGNNEAMCYY